MAEGAQGQQPHGALLHRCEQRVADLAEAGGADPDQAIGQDQGHRNDEGGRSLVLRRQGVDDAAIEDRDVDRGDLGQQHEHQRHHDPHAGALVPDRPQIGQQ